MLALLLVSHLLNGGGEDLGSQLLGVSADSPLKRSLSAGKIMGGRICGGIGFGRNVGLRVPLES